MKEGSERKQGYLPYHRNEKYPKSLTVDFRKLSEESLRTYIARYRLNVRPDASHTELATAVALHFEQMPVDEEAVLGRFFEALDRASQRYEEGDEEMDDDEEENLAKVGEQVAARVTPGGENGSWILASVVSYNKQTETYHVQDEDEATTKIIELPASRIRRLYDECDSEAHDLQKGDRVLAIFPETTSFYRAVISKTPKRNANGSVSEVVLKFEDDEDDAGRTPHRRVNIRYVLRERPTDMKVLSARAAAGPSNNNNNNGGPTTFGGGGGGASGGPPADRPGPATDRMDTSSDRPWPSPGPGDHAPSAAMTYSDMIATALDKLPGHLGSFKQICDLIEADFADHLNWKQEHDAKHTPVWQSSVRKILCSNARFATADKHLFGFANNFPPNKPPHAFTTSNTGPLEAAS